MTSKRRKPGLPDELLQSMKLAGEWMRAVRECAGLSQQQIGFPTKRGKIHVSEMEAGKARLTPPYYEHWARAVGLDPRFVAQAMIGFHTPFLYEPLFGEPFKAERLSISTPSADDNTRVAASLKHLRSEAGLSHGAMAKLLKVPIKVYVAYENGTRRVPAVELETIAEQLGVPASALTEKPAPEAGSSLNKDMRRDQTAD